MGSIPYRLGAVLAAIAVGYVHVSYRVAVATLAPHLASTCEDAAAIGSRRLIASVGSAVALLYIGVFAALFAAVWVMVVVSVVLPVYWVVTFVLVRRVSRHRIAKTADAA